MEPLFTFESNNQADMLTLGIAVFVILASGAGWYQLAYKPPAGLENSRRMMGTMLLFFVILIAASTAIFSVWTMKRTGKVVIYAQYLKTPYGTVALSSIVNASIKEEKQSSLINPNIVRKSVKLLIIEERSGKVHALSEKNYDIRSILDKLRKVVEVNQTG